MVELINDWIATWGAPAIGFLMFVENVFPPIPSEVVMPVAGLAAARGELSVVAVIVYGTAGSVAGATLWFAAGLALGADRIRRFCARHGHWLTIKPEDVDSAQAWFRRWGHLAVLFGRMVPGVRTLISVPAGVAGMGWIPFLLYTTIGSLIWVSGLTMAGHWLGERQHLLTDSLSAVGNLVIAALVAWYLWRVFTLRRRRDAGEK